MAELAQQPTLLGDSTLQGYYKFESGALTTDSSGDGRTLTNNGTVAESVGKFGGAATTGTSNTTKFFRRVSDTYGHTGNGAISISIWLKMNTELGSGQDWVIEKNSNTGNKTHAIYYDYNAGTRRVGFWNDTYGAGSNTSFGTITLGTTTWHHLVYVCNGTNFWGYIDNSATASTAVFATNQAYTIMDGINIGVDCRRPGTDAESNLIDGQFDDVCIFTKALSATEVGILYNSGIKSRNGLVNASVKSINGLARASIKSINGIC